LAWGVNFPAHLVIVKGTEYYDGKTKRYIDFPITDVLQMMGRAGRPQFDDSGVALILVQDTKKHFYKKFLYEPFPVESRFNFLFLFVCLNFDRRKASSTLPDTHIRNFSWSAAALGKTNQKNERFFLTHKALNKIPAICFTDF